MQNAEMQHASLEKLMVFLMCGVVTTCNSELFNLKETAYNLTFERVYYEAILPDFKMNNPTIFLLACE